MVDACCMHYANSESETKLRDKDEDRRKKNSQVCTRNGSDAKGLYPVNISVVLVEIGSILLFLLFHFLFTAFSRYVSRIEIG